MVCVHFKTLLRSPFTVFIGISISVAILAYIVYPLIDISSEHLDEVELFDHFDVNKDGGIGKAEFWSIIPHLQKSTPEKGKQILSPEYITLCSAFVPLDIHSLRSAELDQLDFLLNDTSLHPLLSWTEPEIHQFDVSVGDLTAFLPAKKEIEVGHVWSLYTPTTSSPPEEESSPPSGIPPPSTDGIQTVLTRLLSSFHPRPFLQTRFQPRGGFAVLRAISSTKFDIMFRFHAEFQLSNNALQSFWFTPSQFAGRLVMETDGSHVDLFHLTVPADKSLNVDMEWTSDSGVEGADDTLTVEIGYMQQMELSSPESSSMFPRATCNKSPGGPISHTKWVEEIPLNDAQLLLQKAFFPFKQVDYYNISEAMTRAAEEKKFVHSIVLWGALDDQSC